MYMYFNFSYLFISIFLCAIRYFFYGAVVIFLGGLFVIGLLTLAEDEDMYKFLKSFSEFETLLY